jgi:transcriptional regulator with XRE-family HTH domain
MSPFGERLRQAFNNASNAEIARKLGVSEPAIGNYVKGRIPDADKLLQISTLTGCNLHWLLTGEGRRLAEPDHPHDFQLDRDHPNDFKLDPDHPDDAYIERIHPNDYADIPQRRTVAVALERRIREIVREELQAVTDKIDEYDIEAGVKKYDNALPVLMEWYAHDHLPPPTIGVLAFSGWEKLSLEQKVEQIRNYREAYEEDKEFEEASRHAPKNTKHS